MKVSLITTVYNESDNILKFLNSYKRQTIYADEFIILDGGSCDRTVNIIKKFARTHPELNIKLIIDNQCSSAYSRGPIAKGRNSAITKAKNNIIAVTDAGCALHRKWLYNITMPLKGRGVDVVAGVYKINPENDFQKIYSNLFFPNISEIDAKTFLPSSRSIAFRKSCWRRVGGYPENTFAAEDTKFVLNLKKAGFNFSFAPNALVLWNCPKSVVDALSKEYNYGFGDGYYKLFKRKYLKAFWGFVFCPEYTIFNKIKADERDKIKRVLIASKLRGYWHGLFRI